MRATYITSEKYAESRQIADDIAAFEARGGVVEVLGDTPVNDRPIAAYASQRGRKSAKEKAAKDVVLETEEE